MVWGLLVSTVFAISPFDHEKSVCPCRTEEARFGFVDGRAESLVTVAGNAAIALEGITRMCTQVEAPTLVRGFRISRNLLARMVNQAQESGDHEPSIGLKRYVSGKMRNMCKSKTLQIMEGAQHAQIVEMRKPYDSGKMINMRMFCCKNDGTERRMSTAELGTVQTVAPAEKTKTPAI